MALTFNQIIERLEGIEYDLGERQEDFAQAAEDYHRLVRDYELRIARALVASDARTTTEKKAHALIAVAAASDSPLVALSDAEGRYEGARAAVRVLEQRAMIGMSLAKAHGREPVMDPPARQTYSGARG